MAGTETDFPPLGALARGGYRQPDGAIVDGVAETNQLPASRVGRCLCSPRTRGPGRLQVARLTEARGSWRCLSSPPVDPIRSNSSLGSVTVKRTGIMAGDLYLLAGQSNMVGRAPLVDGCPAEIRRFGCSTPRGHVGRGAAIRFHEALLRGRTGYRGSGVGLAVRQGDGAANGSAGRFGAVRVGWHFAGAVESGVAQRAAAIAVWEFSRPRENGWSGQRHSLVSGRGGRLGGGYGE
jgi:hypothetical protein